MVGSIIAKKDLIEIETSQQKVMVMLTEKIYSCIAVVKIKRGGAIPNRQGLNEYSL